MIRSFAASLALASFILPAQATEIKIYIHSGTGFVVSREGHILTNQHVVDDCERIEVVGAITKHEATIVGTDAEHDLALLKADTVGADVANLSPNPHALQPGDRVVLVGYPGEAFRSGKTVTREAKIVALKGPKDEEKWLQLSDVVAEGNSGGPLLDSAGNVVGVITAKARIYTYTEDAPRNGTTSQSGIAINLPTIEKFLDGQRVRYRMDNVGSYLSADRISDKAQRFVVNVRCEYKREVN